MSSEVTVGLAAGLVGRAAFEWAHPARTPTVRPSNNGAGDEIDEIDEIQVMGPPGVVVRKCNATIGVALVLAACRE
jgi:hypothetical protein